MNRFLAALAISTLSTIACAQSPAPVEMTGTISKVLSSRELVMTDAVGEIHVFKDARIAGAYAVGDVIRVHASQSDDWLKLSAREIIAARIVKIQSAPVVVVAQTEG